MTIRPCQFLPFVATWWYQQHQVVMSMRDNKAKVGLLFCDLTKTLHWHIFGVAVSL